LEQAQEKVSIGMSREEAVKILEAQAWYHQPCENRNSMDDLFFFGDHRYDRAEIVIMHSVKKDDKYEVVQLGSFEPYAWHTAYADCIQRDKFED
jgi:hypothetical protein